MSGALSEGSGNASAEQSVVFVVDDFITLADGDFQTLPVNHRHRSALVGNQFSFGEFLRRQRNAFAPHAEHIGNKVVRHHQFVRVEAVVTQEQPTAKLLFERVETIANGGLRNLCLLYTSPSPRDS